MGPNSSTQGGGPLPTVPDGSIGQISRNNTATSSKDVQPVPTIQEVPNLKLPHFKEKVTLRNFEPVKTVCS